MSTNSNARYFGKYKPLSAGLRGTFGGVSKFERTEMIDRWLDFGFMPEPGPKRVFLVHWIRQYKRITTDPRYVPGKKTRNRIL
jgi:hypothetical protein